MRFEDYPILYVDDDSTNRVVMKHNLNGDFSILLARSGEEALEVLAREPVAVLVTDQRMPGMTGVELTEKVRLLHPDIVRVIITAYSDISATVDAINRGQVRRFIKKPWSYEELTAVLQESIVAYHTNKLVQSLQDRLIGLDHASTIGVLASSIAHDLRNCLTLIGPNVGTLQYQLKRLAEVARSVEVRQLHGKMSEVLEDVMEGVRMLNLMSQFMLDSLAAQPAEMSPILLNDVLLSVLRLTRSALASRAQLQVDLPTDPVQVLGSTGHLNQLVINLIVNAIHALPEGDVGNNKVSISLTTTGAEAVLTVSDTGHGIQEGHLDKIFEPFFSTKGSAGTGLGLSVCKHVVEDHEGSLQVSSGGAGRGATFTVRLPLLTPSPR